MKKILVLGAGFVAGPLVRYFLERPSAEVIVADIEVEKAKILVGVHPRGKALALNVKDEESLKTEIAESDIVISLVPHMFHPVFVNFGIPGSDSSMARLVGLPAAAGTRLILEGKIRRTGVSIPVHPEMHSPILEELEEHGIIFEEKKDAVL